MPVIHQPSSFALSIVFVFLFLAALYESWSVPFSVLLAVPLGAFGAIVALTFLPRLSDNVYAQIGLITLIGLAAKNAILIVEFGKERVDRGMEVIPATIEAVKLRLRPILMTSFAFILGVGTVSLCVRGWRRSTFYYRLDRIGRDAVCHFPGHIYYSGVICADNKICFQEKAAG
jgi:multidrug efflux pump subunit AcrB